MRVDVLAIPRDPRFAEIALAFETKGDREWDIPSWGKTLEQASDYVLARVGPKLAAHTGKHIMATFIHPVPSWPMEPMPNRPFVPNDKSYCLRGMAHMAGYLRVGVTRTENTRWGPKLVLLANEEIWNSERGWRANATNVLTGQRQIGSQRFNILEELAKLA